MTAQEIEAIVGGYHGDAFRVLGPHGIRRKGSQPRWEVRAFLPHAESAAVVSGGQRVAMVKKHNDGFFVGLLSGDPAPYTIAAHLWDGRDLEIEDPYRFPIQLSEYDLHLHNEGTLHEAYRTFGAHCVESEGVKGVRFSVWAPNAENVALAGEFNEWDTRRHPMRRRNGGVWELFVPGLGEGTKYKYNIRSRFARLPAAQGRPLRLLLRDPSQIRFRRLEYRPLPVVRRRVDRAPRRRPTGSRRPSRSTRSTWNRGCAVRRDSP